MKAKKEGSGKVYEIAIDSEFLLEHEGKKYVTMYMLSSYLGNFLTFKEANLYRSNVSRGKITSMRKYGIVWIPVPTPVKEVSFSPSVRLTVETKNTKSRSKSNNRGVEEGQEL